MADPIEYSDEKDSRLFSAASTSERGARKASGNIKFTGAWARLRVASSVGVVSTSSMADPLLDRACPKSSRKPPVDACDGLRAGSWRIAVAPDGGMDTLTLDTLPTSVVSGSLALALRSAGDPLAVVSCCHDRVLSTLTVRESECSMSFEPRACALVSSGIASSAVSHDVCGAGPYSASVCVARAFATAHTNSRTYRVFNNASLDTTWRSVP